MVYANELTFCLYSFTYHYTHLPHLPVYFYSIAETGRSFRFSKFMRYAFKHKHKHKHNNISYSKPNLAFQTNDAVKLYPIIEQNRMPERPKPGFLLIMQNVLSWGQLSALA